MNSTPESIKYKLTRQFFVLCLISFLLSTFSSKVYGLATDANSNIER
jgi:hypothetical protein